MTGLFGNFNPTMDLRAEMPGFNPPGLLGAAPTAGGEGVLAAPSTPMVPPAGPAAPMAPAAPMDAPVNPLLNMWREAYESIQEPKDDVWMQLAIAGSEGISGLVRYQAQQQQRRAMQTLGNLYAQDVARGGDGRAAIQAYIASGNADPETIAGLARLGLEERKVELEAGRLGWDIQSGMPDFRGQVTAAEEGAKAPFQQYQLIQTPNGPVYIQPGAGTYIPGQSTTDTEVEKERRLSEVKRFESTIDAANARIPLTTQKMERISRLETLLDQLGPDVEMGGAPAEWLQEVRTIGAGFGLNKDEAFKNKTALIEEFAAVTEGMVAEARPEGAGATSDMEYKSYKQTVANLRKTPQGNREVLRYNMEMLERQKARDMGLLKYREAGGTSMSEFNRLWDAYLQENPPSWMETP